MSADRGEIALGVVLLLCLLSGLGGYVGARVEQRLEFCGDGTLCLYGEVRDGLDPNVSSVWMVPDETGAVGGLVVPQPALQLADTR